MIHGMIHFNNIYWVYVIEQWMKPYTKSSINMESYIMKFDSKWLKKNTKKGVPSNFSTGTEWISNDLKTRILW